MQLRQGDVFLNSCSEPDGLCGDFQTHPEHGRLILAHGESTGHAHAVKSSHAMMYMMAGAMYLKVLQRTQLLHEEHRAIDVEPGFYRVTRQREYTPSEIRRVED